MHPPAPILKQNRACIDAPWRHFYQTVAHTFRYILSRRTSRLWHTLGWLTLHQAPTGPENEVSWPVKYLLTTISVYDKAGDEPRGAPA
jgi:hypothetical protein